MDKGTAQAKIMRHIGGMEREMPIVCNGSAVWADAVQQIASLIANLRSHLDSRQYVELLAVGAMAHRQCKAEQAVGIADANERPAQASPYVWLHDAPGDGWDVEVPGGPDSNTHDRWFRIRREAQLFADGMQSAAGWAIVDDSTARSDDEENEAERAAQAVDEFFQGLKNSGGFGND